MATTHTPPRIQAARKSLPGSTSAILPSITATSSPSSLQKRKWQGGSLALPLPGLTQTAKGIGGAPVAPMARPKRQKVEEQVKLEQQSQNQQHISVPANPPQVPNGLPHPVNPPFNQRPILQPSMQPPMQPVQQPARPIIPQKIFVAALNRDISLQPVAPTTIPIGSQLINAIAHSMWDVVISQEEMMTEITMKAALFTPLKLRALARLNWLPSWWFLREMAVALMRQLGWLVDDGERQGQWTEAVNWCKKAEIKCFGGGTSAATQGGGLTVVKVQEVKEEAAAAVTGKVES